MCACDMFCRYGKGKSLENSIEGIRKNWKMDGRTVGEERSGHFSMEIQYELTFIGNAGEDS